MGTPEQCPTTLNGEAEVLLPWRPMRQLKTGCHGNQFGSLWGHLNGLVPGSWQQCWSMRHGMAGTVGCSRAGLSPIEFPKWATRGPNRSNTAPNWGTEHPKLE